MTMPNPVKVLYVCGLGMRSSLILRVTMKTAVNRMGLNAEIGHIDLSSTRSMEPGVMVGQGIHTDELEGVTPIIVSADDFLGDVAVEEKLRAALTVTGWDTC